MSSNNKRLIHTYAYDALDRHIKSGSSGADVTQLFYCQKRLITEIKGTVSTHVFETEHVVLAQHALQGSAHTTTLIAGDDKRSTLALLNNSQPQPLAYNPYGHSAELPMLHLMAGFNGERRDPLSGYYLLGNGYRAFNPALMRFNSPDSLSPFGDGGINAYAYYGGDPVNREDPTGHIPRFLTNFSKNLRNALLKKNKSVSSSLNDLYYGAPSHTNYYRERVLSSLHSNFSPIPTTVLTSSKPMFPEAKHNKLRRLFTKALSATADSQRYEAANKIFLTSPEKSIKKIAFKKLYKDAKNRVKVYEKKLSRYQKKFDLTPYEDDIMYMYVIRDLYGEMLINTAVYPPYTVAPGSLQHQTHAALWRQSTTGS